MALPRYRTGQHRQCAICLASLALPAPFSFALVLAVPSLIGRDPVLLEALRSSTAAMVAAGARLSGLRLASLELTLLSCCCALLALAGVPLLATALFLLPSRMQPMLGRPATAAADR